MRPTIELKINSDLKTRYQDMLREEWASLLDKALQLIEDQLRISGSRLIATSNATVNAQDESPSMLIPSLLTDDLIPFLDRLHTFSMPPLPEAFLGKQAAKHKELYKVAIRVAFCLTVQSRFDLRGESGFFRDIQSLVFTAAIDELLPLLKTSRSMEIHNLVVNVLIYHCTVIWRDEVAQQQYLLALIAGYANDEELESKSLLASFHLTDADEHDYLTRAQACVFHFLRYRRYDKAKSFLLNVLRQARSESLDELREMLDDVYADEASGKGKAHRRTGVKR